MLQIIALYLKWKVLTMNNLKELDGIGPSPVPIKSSKGFYSRWNALPERWQGAVGILQNRSKHDQWLVYAFASGVVNPFKIGIVSKGMYF